MGKGTQTKQALIDGALEMTSRVGLENVTMGTLAEEMKISKSGLFAHFKSKEALQLEVLDEVAARFAAQVSQPTLEQPPGEARLRALFEHYLAWIERGVGRGGCVFMALSFEYDDRPGVIHDRVVERQKRWLPSLAALAKEAIDAGEFRADLDVRQFAHEMFALLTGFQLTYKLLADRDAIKRSRSAFEDLLARSRTPAKRASTSRRKS